MTAVDQVPRDVDSIAVGESLPALTVVLTFQRLIMEAGANRDFNPVHFDPDIARRSGAPGVFANTTFIETLVEALLRQWAGLEARIRVLEFSMLGFNCEGDEIVAGGAVSGRRDRADDVEFDVDAWVDGPRGRTVAGIAIVDVPRRR